MSANRAILHCFFLLAILTPPFAHAESEKAILLLQGEDSLKLGKFSEALAKFERALDAAEKKKDFSQMADAFYKIGICQNSLAKYSEATRALNEAEKLHRQVGDQQAIGFDLTEMGRTESLRSNFDEALKVFEKALAIHQQTKSIKGEADTLRQIGNVHLSRGDYEKALTFSQQALALATQIGDKQLVASIEKDIGAIHFRLGEYDLAMQHLEISMKTAEEIGDKKSLAQALSNIALIYSEQGDLDRELEYYRKSGKLAEEIGDVPQQCVVLLNSAAVFFNKGEFKESNDYFQKALKLSTEIENKRYISGSVLGLAMVQFAWGTNDVGLDYLRKAQVIAEQIGDKHVLTYALNELGWYANEAGDYATAMKYFQRSLAVREEMNDKRGIAASLNYLAHAYFKLGKYQEAMDSCTHALAISEALGIKKEISTSYEKMALIHQIKKEMPEAKDAISKAIEIAKALGDRDLLSEELHTQGIIFRDNNQTEEAFASLKEEVQVIESIRSEIDLPERKAGYLETRHEAYADLIDLYLRQRRIPEAFEFAQRSKARAFLDMMAEIQIDPLTTEDPDLQKRKSLLSKEMVDIHNQIESEREDEKPELIKIRQLVEKRNKLDEQYSNLAEEIRQKNPYLAQIKYPQTVGLTESQNLLDDQTILLEYFIGETGSMLFAITNDKAEVFALPNEDQMTARIKEIRELMQKPEPAWEISDQSHTKYIKLSSSLYKVLLKPAEAMFKSKQRIVIAPDGPLYYLPFESLITVTPAAGNLDFATFAYLAIQHEVQYVPSASVLAAFEKKQETAEHQTRQKDLLVFADPALGSGSTGKAQVREWVGQLSSLPYTRDEAKAIAGVYPNDETSVLIGKQASEKNAKTLDLAGFRRIHFASHGLIDEERPQFSALVLSADSTDKEDGFLTMPEIFDLKLNADLVVLSACKTGLGKRIRGEGVTGISRAFLCAGASSVLVSLWNVYDRSSAEFMTNFYRAMEKEHKNKADALREARLEMIRGKKYSHPYYWAPFVLIGSR